MQRARTVGGAVAACAQPNCRHGLPRRSRIVEGNELLLPQCTAGEKGRRQHIERGAHCLVYLLRRAGERGRGTSDPEWRRSREEGRSRRGQLRFQAGSIGGVFLCFSPLTHSVMVVRYTPPAGGPSDSVSTAGLRVTFELFPFCHTQHGPQPTPHSGRPPCWHSG